MFPSSGRTYNICDNHFLFLAKNGGKKSAENVLLAFLKMRSLQKFVQYSDADKLVFFPWKQPTKMVALLRKMQSI